MAETQAAATPDAASALEVYKAVRAQIVDESTLVGIRLGWLIGAEAFLVVAYATVLTVTTKTASEAGAAANFVSQSERLYSALPIAGFVLSLLMGLGAHSLLHAATREVHRGRFRYRSGAPQPGWLVVADHKLRPSRDESVGDSRPHH